MKELDRIKRVAIKVVVDAGRYSLKRMGNHGSIDYKGSFNNLVTDVDKRCEEIIVSRINRHFPSHSILAEERGRDTRGELFTWVIDPIDGTTNYTHGFPFFCVAIGIMFADTVKIGVVYDPSRKELFFAEQGKGAFLNKRRIKVSEKKIVRDSLVSTGFAYDPKGKVANIDYFKKILNKAQAVRRPGSAAMDLCYVACGRFDAFWELGLSPWDTAAAQLIVKEAGGTVTTLNNDPFDIFQKQILASNTTVHKEMLYILKGEA